MNTKRIVSILVLAVLALSVALYLGACGDNGGGGGTSPDEAAAQASAVSGAVQLSSTIGDATGMAGDSIPAGYAPGKVGALDTSKIGNIDPRLKDVVDKMMAELQKPAVRNAVSKVRSKTMSSAPLSAATISATATCSPTGTYTITGDTNTVVSSVTTTTNTLTVIFDNCQDNSTSTYSMLAGSITGTHVFDSAGYESADLTVQLTDTTYEGTSFNTVTGIFALNGVFKSTNNNGASGTNSAEGSFTMTMPSPSGNLVMSFSFGSAGNPVTDVWTDSNPIGDGTFTRTGNGVFRMSVSMPGMQTITLNITLTNLVDSVTTSAGDEYESISGRVSISWTPEMSEYGCKSGTFDISTTSPVHTPSGSYCPTSGTVKINDATIQFGSPAPYGVTVSVGGESKTFGTCYEFEGSGSMCSGG